MLTGQKKNITNQSYTVGEYEEFYEKDGRRLETKGSYYQEMGLKGVSKNYMLSLNMAKEISMYTGAMPRANEVLKKNSKMVRRYFVLMEKIVKENKDWFDTRNPQRTNYKPMCDAISEDIFHKTGRCGDKYDFAREANIMNRIATGCSAAEIKLYLGAEPNEATRDYLTQEYNERISFLQDQNILLAGMHMNTVDRIKMLIQFFDIKFPNAEPIQKHKNREFLLEQRKQIIAELS